VAGVYAPTDPTTMRTDGYFPEGEARETCYEKILAMSAKELHKQYPITASLQFLKTNSKVEPPPPPLRTRRGIMRVYTSDC
jgi:hypothetical protein